MQPTLIDVAIALFIVMNVLGACHRGLGREMLHTVLFLLLVGIGYILFRTSAIENENDIVFWLINSSYYLITAYVLTWVGMKVLSPIVLGPQAVGLRSRFWAGVISISKLAAVLFGLNLWFAMHSDKPHPQRIEALPAILQNSVAVHISDKLTEDLYRWLAAKNVVEYKKNTYRREDINTTMEQDLKQELGIQ